MEHIEWHRVTWYSKLIALIVLVVFPFVGFYWGIQYGKMVQATNQETGALSTSGINSGQEYYGNVSEWQIDQDSNGGFSIAYPIDFSETDNYSSAPSTGWRLNSNNEPGVEYFTLTIPRAFEPQTNFADATLTVGASQNATAVGDCLTADESGGPPMATSTQAINGIPFVVFKSSDAGAGNYYETTSYRTLHDGQCYAVEYTVHSGQIANYPPQYNLQPFDDAEVTALLNRMVGTFKFL